MSTSGPRGQHHPARMLGGVAGQAPRLAGQPGRARASGPSCARAEPIASSMSFGHRLGPVIHVDGASDALDLARRQPEGLAEVAHRRARAIAGERGHQRRALGAVALVDPRDQPLADVAGEVEVDVGGLGDLLVQEAPQEQLVSHRVDVREAGEVADDRAHARAPARARGAAASGPSRGPGPPPRPRAPARGCRSGAGRSPRGPASGSGQARPPAGGVAWAYSAHARVAMLQPRPAELGKRPVGAGILRARGSGSRGRG